MASNFLQLTNRILKGLNEVPLDATTFTSATGFYTEAQDAINQAIFDIYSYEDTEWPFLWGNTTIPTVVGQTDYTRTDTFTKLNWDSFRIQRGKPLITSITQTAGVATASCSTAHLLLTGDIVTISGASQSGYNINGAVTVTSSTQFTFTVDSSTVSPATGTILCVSETVQQKKLQLKAWDQYTAQKYWDTDQNTDYTGYGTPDFIVRKPDNSLYFGMPPDRVYTVYYEGYTYPAALSLYSDTTLIPIGFEQVIVDKAMHYAYMFRDNVEEAALAQDRYEKNIVKMRRVLIPQETYAIASD